MSLLLRGEQLDPASPLSAYSIAAGETTLLELNIVYLEGPTGTAAYTMPDVVAVEVHFGADIPPKMIQVRRCEAAACASYPCASHPREPHASSPDAAGARRARDAREETVPRRLPPPQDPP